MKTRLQIMEVDSMRKDKLLKELMVKQEAISSYNSHHGISPQKTTASQRITVGLKTETHLVMNLKNTIVRMNAEY